MEEFKQPNQLEQIEKKENDKKEVALKLIEDASHFEGLEPNKGMALLMIEKGESWAVIRNASHFEGFELNKEIALLMIEKGETWTVAENVSHFEGLDKEVALKLIEKGKTRAVIENVSHFDGFEPNKGMALLMIEKGESWAVIRNASHFKGFELNKEIALLMIEKGETWTVAENVSHFEGLDKEVALKLIEKGGSWAVIRNASHFEGLEPNKEIALLMIEKGETWTVAENVSHFKGLDREVALKLIEEGKTKAVAENASHFEGLDKEVALKLIEEGGSWAVIRNASHFEGLEPNKEIALLMIENGGSWAVIENASHFKGLDKEVALKLIEKGEIWEVIKNASHFEGLELNKEIALLMIENGGAWTVAENASHFEGLDKEVALKLIEKGKTRAVAENASHFEGLDKEVALKLIEKGKTRAVAENASHFEGLDKEVAIELINQGEGAIVFKKIDQFVGVELDKKFALEISKGSVATASFLDSKDGEEVLSSLFKIDKGELKKVQDLNLRYSEFFITENLIEQDKLFEKESQNKINKSQKFQKIFEHLKENHPFWKEENNLVNIFQRGSEYFGYDKMFQYLNSFGYNNRHDLLYNFDKICELAQLSNLSSNEFYNNILEQVVKDGAVYNENENEFNSFQKLNNLVNKIDLDFEKKFKIVEQYSDIKKLKKIIDQLDAPKKIFQSWKMLKKYEEICQIVNQKEILDQLKKLKKENKENLYNYIETLAFHPNISMKAVLDFWYNTRTFLGLKDQHTPRDLQDSKKPSNYFNIPNLDLTPEELRDALVEGDYDSLQTFNPLEIVYSINLGNKQDKNYLTDRKDKDKNFKNLIFEAVGKRKKGKEGKAKDTRKLFAELNRFFKENQISLKDYLSSDNPEEEFPGIEKIKNKLNDLLFDPKIGLDKKTQLLEGDEYRAKINLKSDPDGVVAGNDTACCMPFGSGKNNIYTFNPNCSLFTVQKKNSKGVWRTIAQSVLTNNKEIKENIEELVEKMKKPEFKMHELIDENILLDSSSVVVCDNIEVADNFKNHPQKDEILKSVYTDFFKEYMKRFAKEEKLNKEKIIIGTGYADALENLPTVENNFIPKAPVGYSDNLHSQSFLLNLTEPINNDYILSKKISINSKLKEVSKKEKIKLPKGTSNLTFEDILPVAYIEGKAYHDNEGLMEYMHNMENALIAKDVNNISKNRPNLSFKYTDNQGKIHGYLLAYEGTKGNYNEEDYEGDKDGNKKEVPIIYIADLASDGHPRAGGSLILAILEAYQENYLKKNKLIPVYAQLREKTSYQIVKKQLEKIGNKIDINFELEELGEYLVNDEPIHEVMIIPRKKNK